MSSLEVKAEDLMLQVTWFKYFGSISTRQRKNRRISKPSNLS